MAIIGKIRNNSWLLVGVVGFAMVAFIISSYYGNQQVERTGYGSINGEPIDPKLYEIAINNYQEADKQQYASQNRPYTAQDQKMSEDKAFNAIVDSILLQKEFNQIGVSVSDREFEAYLYGKNGFSVLPDIANTFKDPTTGLFSETMLRKRIDAMKASTNPQERLAWNQTKNSLILQRLQEKYFLLLNQGLFTTTLEAKDSYEAQKAIRSISFVVKRFSEIPDDEIKIKDEELKQYYEEHKNDAKYQVESNARDVKYFTIPIAPSKEDSSLFFNELEAIKTQFASLTTAKEDSLFVSRKSEWPYYVAKVGFRSENAPNVNKNFTYPASMDSVFQSAAVGSIIGPYLDKGKYRLAKVIGMDHNIYSVRHILLSAQRTDTNGVIAKKKTADSLLTLINTTNFELYVTQYSEDPGSAQSGGKIENFIYGEMVPEFSDFAKNNPVGKIGWVQSDFGIHIIEVMEKKSGNVPQLAIVEKTLKPSGETLDHINLEANNILGEVLDAVENENTVKGINNAFDTVAAKNDKTPLTITINEEKIQVYGMKSTFAEDRLIALAFDDKNKVGTVHLSPIKDEDRYLVAMLSLKRDEGVPSFEVISEALRRELMNEKKAEIIKSQLIGKSIEKMAEKNNLKVQKSDITFGNPSIMGGGYDPQIVGSLFSTGIKDGMTTLPLVGRSAVYVVRVNKTTAAPATKNYDAEKQILNNQVQSSMSRNVISGLRENSNIIDNRRFLQVGVRY